MDPTVVRRLVLCKYQFLRGRNELNQNAEIGDWEAVKDFHDAMETFLIAVADAKGIRGRTVRFHEYPGKIGTDTGLEFIHGKIVDEINDLRTPYKHHGTYPNAKAVRQLVPVLEIVFERNTKQYLGVNFSDVTLGSMVDDPEVQTEIKSAESAMASGDFGSCLEALKAGLLIQIEKFRQSWLPLKQRHWAELPKELFSFHPAEPLSREISTQLRQANETYSEMKTRLDLLLLGVNLADYMRFDAVTPLVQFTDGGRRFIYESDDTSPLTKNKANCDFCLAFVLETVLRLQSQFHIHDSWNLFIVRIRERTPLLSYENGNLLEVGWLEVGREVERVKSRIVLGETNSFGHFWRWESNEGERYFSMGACDIVEEIPPAVI